MRTIIFYLVLIGLLLSGLSCFDYEDTLMEEPLEVEPTPITHELSPPLWIQGIWIDPVTEEREWEFRASYIYIKDRNGSMKNFNDYIIWGWTEGHWNQRVSNIEKEESDIKYVLRQDYSFSIGESYAQFNATELYYFVFSKLSQGEICYRRASPGGLYHFALNYDDFSCIPDSLGGKRLIRK